MLRQYMESQRLREKEGSCDNEEVRCKIRIPRVLSEGDIVEADGRVTVGSERISENGTIRIEHPNVPSGHKMVMRLERFTWHAYIDWKYFYCDLFHIQPTYIMLGGVKTEIPLGVVDLPSLMAGMEGLGTYYRSDANLNVLNFKKSLSLSSDSPPHAVRWWKALGLKPPPHVYPVNSTEYIMEEDVLLKPGQVFDIVMVSTEVDYPTYGDESHVAVLAQVYLERPIGGSVAFNATYDTINQPIKIIDDKFKLQIRHNRTSRILNKHTLGASSIEIELRLKSK